MRKYVSAACPPTSELKSSSTKKKFAKSLARFSGSRLMPTRSWRRLGFSKVTSRGFSTLLGSDERRTGDNEDKQRFKMTLVSENDDEMNKLN